MGGVSLRAVGGACRRRRGGAGRAGGRRAAAALSGRCRCDEDWRAGRAVTHGGAAARGRAEPRSPADKAARAAGHVRRRRRRGHPPAPIPSGVGSNLPFPPPPRPCGAGAARLSVPGVRCPLRAALRPAVPLRFSAVPPSAGRGAFGGTQRSGRAAPPAPHPPAGCGHPGVSGVCGSCTPSPKVAAPPYKLLPARRAGRLAGLFGGPYPTAGCSFLPPAVLVAGPRPPAGCRAPSRPLPSQRPPGDRTPRARCRERGRPRSPERGERSRRRCPGPRAAR